MSPNRSGTSITPPPLGHRAAPQCKEEASTTAKDKSKASTPQAEKPSTAKQESATFIEELNSDIDAWDAAVVAAVAEMEAAAAEIDTAHEDSGLEAIFDSGATSHMTSHRAWFASISPHRVPIQLADKSVIYSEAKGDVHFVSEGSDKLIAVSDVLYVPMLGCNLFSVLHLTEHKQFKVVIVKGKIDFIRGSTTHLSSILTHPCQLCVSPALWTNTTELSSLQRHRIET